MPTKRTPVSNFSVIATAPCRADLAGGTLDMWPLYLFHKGAVTVNVAVSILTTCRVAPRADRQIHLKSSDTGREEVFASLDALCRTRKYKHPLAAHLVRFFAPEGGLSIETHSESPAGAGISGSSALMISTTAALARYTERRMDRESIRALAQNIEAQLIQVPTGCQDYYPALYGGVSAIHLDADGIHREPVPVAAEEVESRFLLCYTGAPRQSGINNWEVFKAHINGDKRVFRNFEEIAQIARGMHDALSDGRWDDVARLLHEEWTLRRTNAPGITTPLIDKLVSAARRAGGRAAKVCGAGGGGCVIFFAEPDAKQRVAEALRKNGGHILPFRVAREGLRVMRTSLSKPARG
jgi:D-glycero-alpha-D-manno-heptose-7-phosphate kinase